MDVSVGVQHNMCIDSFGLAGTASEKYKGAHCCAKRGAHSMKMLFAMIYMLCNPCMGYDMTCVHKTPYEHE
eukprot:2175542-Karenia_brevis.AAC.1